VDGAQTEDDKPEVSHGPHEAARVGLEPARRHLLRPAPKDAVSAQARARGGAAGRGAVGRAAQGSGPGKATRPLYHSPY